jgi:hypothetical protein
VAIPALVRHVDAPLKRQDAHFLSSPKGIVAAQVVGEGGRDIVGCLVQALEAAFGVAQAAGLGVLPGFGPQRSVGAAHLAGHIARHLRRQAKQVAHIRIGRFLQTLAVARFAMRKGVGADVIQGSAVREPGWRAAHRTGRAWSAV